MSDRGQEPFCYTCHNRGYIVNCIDDLCANSDYCIHDDGIKDCQDCDNEWDYSLLPPDGNFNILADTQKKP